VTETAISKSQRTRQLIIERAASLFNQKGYFGTSMDDIMRATGLSKGGLYGNFSNKEEIALAAFEHAVATVSQEVRRRTKQHKDVLDKLRAVVQFYQERILNPPVEGGCPIQNTAVEADDSDLTLRQSVQAALREWEQSIVYVLQRGRQRGEVRPDADVQAFAVRFIATLEGAILLTRLYKEQRYFDIVSEQLFDSIENLRP